jgi:translocation and assembly module TamB
LSLAFLNAFKPEAVQNIKGVIALDMTLRGTWRDPEPRGTFQLQDGAFDAKALGTQLSAVVVEGSADAQRISLTRLSARSGDGTLGGSGVITLRRFLVESVSLDFKARRWPAIQTEQYRAQVNANLKVAGALSALRIAGAVQVIEGSVRPELDFLGRGPISLTRDPTIIVVQHRGGKPLAAESSEKAAAENGELFQQLVLEVAVTIPNNFWIRHPNANIELSGKLNVVKKPESELSMTGLVEVVRGWVGFQGRRFTLSEGRIQFAGGKPENATLNVTAEYRVDNYLVNAVVNGTVEKPALTLRSTPALEQSDILSLLLFGKPVAQLTSDQQTSLQQNAINVGAGFAAATLGKAVSDALGLQNLGIDLSDISFSGGHVRFGRYVGPRTYLSVSQEISGEHGHEVSLEYQLARDWRLGATTATERGNGVDLIWRKRY